MEYSIFTNDSIFVAVSNECHLTKSDKSSNELMVSSAIYNMLSIDDWFVFVRESDNVKDCEFLITYK